MKLLSKYLYASMYRYASILLLVFFISFGVLINTANAQDKTRVVPGNFGLPGIIDLPTALKFPDGELIVTQQIHKSLARSGISFQALPWISFSFRYSGHGVGGGEAYGRFNHDRSFDAHLSIFDEGTYRPAISVGLRDFIGTGWYSSEYIVSTKTIGNFELTVGLGFGRLAGRDSFSNPVGRISSKFENRAGKGFGAGGTLGDVTWFQGNTSTFYGVNYRLGKKLILSSEYTPDLMLKEHEYLDIKSPWNYGLKYELNDNMGLALEYLHGSQLSFTANVFANPGRPPLKGGMELAPVPMRLRGDGALPVKQSNETLIRKVLAADKFEIHHFKLEGEAVQITVTNTKFRSTAQAVGRLASTLQRFTSDTTKIAYITFQRSGLLVASYRVDLYKVTKNQFSPTSYNETDRSIIAINTEMSSKQKVNQQFVWGVGPYIEHRLFNPDLPLSIETGVELEAGYKFTPNLKLSGALRKSILTNLTDNRRRSNSVLPRVHSDWPLYDFAGQSGHINSLTVSYVKNLAPAFFGKVRAGLLEPFFAGIGGELLYKQAQSPFAVGLDIHHVKKRDYDMLFDLLDYEATIGHLSFYYDVGRMFDLEVNAGRYLAGDWGVTTTISRKFGSGWEVGGYATLTDVPFATFGEGSFDKAIYVSIPIDWIVSSPNKTKRRLALRPITRDGGANLASARSLYAHIKGYQNSDLKREYGRLWK